MTTAKVAFIGRKPEIESLLAAILDWGTQQAVFVHGSGGVGKTSLLNEARKRLEGNLQQPQVAETDTPQIRIFDIDLDDLGLQSPEEISLRIIIQVCMGNHERQQYVSELRKLHQLEQVNSDQISEQKRRLEDTFIRLYNDSCSGVRTVILCDTTDVISTESGREALSYLMLLNRSLRNTIAIFAGQNADDLYRAFGGETAPILTRLLRVGPFPLEDSRNYLRQKQERLHIVIDPDTEQKILLLSRGIPFLIDLAAEWRAREIPLPWLMEQSLEALQSMHPEEAEGRQEDFEASLVRHIQQLRRPLDRLTLTLAWVHPVDVKLCARLFDLSEEQATELVSDARDNIAYIKSLPKGKVKLHDYMQNLVLKHVWPNIEEERRRRDSQKAVEYFEVELQEMSRQLALLDSDLANSRTEYLGPPDAFLTRAAVEREYWQTSIQVIEHALFADIDRGAAIFCKLFDEAFRRQRVPVMNRMIASVMKQKDRFRWEDRVEVGLRYAEFQQFSEKYYDAKNELDELIGHVNLSPSQQVRALILRGNVGARDAEKPQEAGMNDFRAAIKIAEDNQLQEELGQAKLEVGWAYSTYGNWPEANGYFEEALRLALDTQNKQLEAKALNELAYTRAAAHPTAAIQLCNEAISIWEELKDRPGLGRSYSNMGTILYRTRDYVGAQRCFGQAKEIFEPANVAEWIGIVSSWEAITHCAQAENINEPEQTKDLLRQAEVLIKDALKIDVHRERARNHGRFARILRDQGREAEAWGELWKAYNASRQIPDFVYEVASLRDLSSMALEMKRFDTYEDLKSKLNRCEKQGIPLAPHGAGFGNALVNIGIMGIYSGDAYYGFESIAKGLKHSAEAGDYANYTFNGTLQTMHRLVEQFVSASERRELASYLRRFWDNEGLSRKHIEAIRAFYKL